MQQRAAEQNDDPEGALRALLADVLGLTREQVAGLGNQTALFGALPQFDSMAVANLLTAVEDRFGVLIEDDDVAAEDFETFGSLKTWLERLTGR